MLMIDSEAVTMIDTVTNIINIKKHCRSIKSCICCVVNWLLLNTIGYDTTQEILGDSGPSPYNKKRFLLQVECTLRRRLRLVWIWSESQHREFSPELRTQ